MTEPLDLDALEARTSRTIIEASWHDGDPDLHGLNDDVTALLERVRALEAAARALLPAAYAGIHFASNEGGSPHSAAEYVAAVDALAALLEDA